MVVTVFNGIEVIAENTTAIDEEHLEVRNSGMFDLGGELYELDGLEENADIEETQSQQNADAQDINIPYVVEDEKWIPDRVNHLPVFPALLTRPTARPSLPLASHPLATSSRPWLAWLFGESGSHG